MRFLSLGSVIGADQTVLRSAASAAAYVGDRSDGSNSSIMRGNPALYLADTRERRVQSQLQFRRDQPVLRIDGVVLWVTAKRTSGQG